MNVQNVTTTADQRAVCRAMRLTTHTRSKTTAPIRLLTAAVTAFICVEDICQNIKLHTELQNTNRNSKGHFAPWAPHLHRQKKFSVRSNIVSFHGLFFHKQKKKQRTNGSCLSCSGKKPRAHPGACWSYTDPTTYST